jgi:hypothetical protein
VADLSLNGLKYLQIFASNWPAVHVRNACLKIISKFQFKQDSSLGVVEGQKTWNFVAYGFLLFFVIDSFALL